MGMNERERFGSRIAFILISAGCAIGLGNVWRFPYVVGAYGGGAFLLIYLLFLALLGVPILTMELSVGRASRRSVASSFRALQPPGTKWHWFGPLGMAGNYLLMMFYTTVSAWTLLYLFKSVRGDFADLSAQAINAQFPDMLARPWLLMGTVTVVVLLGFGICSLGLRRGVERVTKVMMSLLLVLMAALAVYAVTLDGAGAGLRYYLVPDFSRMLEKGIGNALFAALGQAFFTLSTGMGSMALFASYIGRERTLLGESLSIATLDTLVALCAGLILFPACFAYGVSPHSGPPLIFQTLPNLFNAMPLGRLWGSLFFLFLAFAALSTVITVFENIVSFAMDLWAWPRKKACLINAALLIALSLPCVLGFHVLRAVHPLGGDSTIMDFEDFLVSNNLLPLGALVYAAFCCNKRGWGFEAFLREANAGRGPKFPRWLRPYVRYVIPAIVLTVLIGGYVQMGSG